MKMIQTDVKCPHCGEPLCNFCGLNGTCQDCRKDLPVRVQREVAKAVGAAARE